MNAINLDLRPGSSSGSAHLAPATATDVTIRNFHVAAFSTQTKCPAFGNGCKCVQFMLNSTKPDRVEATHSENLRLMLLCSAAGEPSLLLNLPRIDCAQLRPGVRAGCVPARVTKPYTRRSGQTNQNFRKPFSIEKTASGLYTLQDRTQSANGERAEALMAQLLRETG
jgi:hypothetical protein